MTLDDGEDNETEGQGGRHKDMPGKTTEDDRDGTKENKARGQVHDARPQGQYHKMAGRTAEQEDTGNNMS